MRCIGIVVVALAVVTCDLRGQDDRLYWIDGDLRWVRRATFDGDCDVEILNSYRDPGWGADVDSTTGEVYCTDPGFGPDRVLRVAADGASVEVLWSDVDAEVRDLQLDLAAGKIYWVDLATGLLRSNLDGSAVETVIDATALGAAGEIAVDAEAGRIYWTEFDQGEIRRADLDGSDVVVITASLDEPYGLAHDPTTDLLYVSDDDGLKRVGERVETLVEQFGVWGLDLDSDAGLLYWANSGDDIWRANVDGTDVQKLGGGPQGLAVAIDHVTDRLYWLSPGNDFFVGEGIFVYDSATGEISSYFTSAVLSPVGITIDPATEQMFWTNAEYGVMRSSLHGSDPRLVHRSTWGELVLGVSVDPAAGRLYWTTPETIMRSDLDGEDVEQVHAQPGGWHLGIAVDPDAGKMYWIDSNADAILRADVDGTDVETLLVSAGEPRGLALDLVNAGLYWTEASGDVRRANLDGSGVETIASVEEAGRAIAVDPRAGLVFWAESSSGDAYRANLDGSEMQQLPLFTQRISGLAIGPYDQLADVNEDGVVDVADLIALILGWGSDDPALDIDGDGVVDVPDLFELLSRWGECT